MSWKIHLQSPLLSNNTRMPWRFRSFSPRTFAHDKVNNSGCRTQQFYSRLAKHRRRTKATTLYCYWFIWWWRFSHQAQKNQNGGVQTRKLCAADEAELWCLYGWMSSNRSHCLVVTVLEQNSSILLLYNNKTNKSWNIRSMYLKFIIAFMYVINLGAMFNATRVSNILYL